MKYIFTSIFIFLTLSCSAESTQEKSEKMFWNLVADFEENFNDKEITEQNINELARLAVLADDRLVSIEVFLKQVKFLKAYSSLDTLNNYFISNFNMISENHIDYLKLYTDHVVLLTLLGNNDKVKRARALLEKRDNKANTSFVLALSLYLHPSKANYSNLNRHCLSKCNFSLYHISKMEYFKSNQEIDELESYAENLLNLLLSNELMVDDSFFVDYVMTYLGIALKSQSKNEMASHFIEGAVKGFSKNSFVYTRLKSISIME